MIFSPFAYRQEAISVGPTPTPTATGGPTPTATSTPTPTPTPTVPSIVTDGLQLYLDAGLTDSYPGTGTTWNDLSGNGNHLTLVNGPVWTSSDGGYFTFDGSNDYVSNYSYTNQYTGNNFTYVGVIRYDNKSNQYHNIFDRYNSVNPMLWVNTASKLEANQAAGYTTPLSYTGQTIQVAMVHSNTAGIGVKVYINGTFIGENTAAQGAIGQNGRFSLYRRETSGNFYKGRGYNLMIYNKVLSPTEITQNYDALKSRYGI